MLKNFVQQLACLLEVVVVLEIVQVLDDVIEDKIRSYVPYHSLEYSEVEDMDNELMVSYLDLMLKEMEMTNVMQMMS